MKYIREYQIFESEPIRTVFNKEQLNWLDECAAGSWKLNPQTGLINVDGNFDCNEQDLTDLKGIKFGKVSGDFYCYRNELTSLEGAPQTVGGDFRCGSNQLTSLEGAPQTVNGDFGCSNNQLTTLVGAPKTVGGYFNCYDNLLTSLEGAPQTVKESFRCYNNKLTSLGGAPKTIKGNFYCGNNPVSKTTLGSIFELMEKGKPYQQALEERWPKMEDEDRALMYKQMPNLTPEETRKYKALATYGNIKGYL